MTSRRCVLTAAALGAVAALSRIPFATRTLWQWDSVLYARALEQGFHVDSVLYDSRPHPPGYLFYVTLASLVHRILDDSNAALVAVSVLATVVAVTGVFLLAHRLVGYGRATFAAAGFALSPVVWLYGEVAYPYTTLAAVSVGLAAAFHAARARGASARVGASALFGLAAGFRQDALVLFAPLWLWTIWPGTPRQRVACATAVLGASLAWLVPTAALSDGPGEYVDSLLRQTSGVMTAYSAPLNGFAALAYNASFTGYGLLLGVGAFAFLLAGLAPRALAALRSRPSGDALFLTLWSVPPLAFYVVVHIGEWGYLLSVLPALYILVAMLLPSPARVPERWRVAAAAACVGSGALVFLFGRTQFAAAALAEHDRALEARVAYVRANFPPESTIVLAREDYLHVRYYLAEYRAYRYDPDPYASRTRQHLKMPRHEMTVVLFTSGLQPSRPQDVRYVEVTPRIRLAYFQTAARAVVELEGSRFLVDNDSRAY